MAQEMGVNKSNIITNWVHGKKTISHDHFIHIGMILEPNQADCPRVP